MTATAAATPTTVVTPWPEGSWIALWSIHILDNLGGKLRKQTPCLDAMTDEDEPRLYVIRWNDTSDPTSGRSGSYRVDA